MHSLQKWATEPQNLLSDFVVTGELLVLPQLLGVPVGPFL